MKFYNFLPFFIRKWWFSLKRPSFPQVFSSILNWCIKVILLYSNIIQFIKFFFLKYGQYLKFPIFSDFSSINDVLASKSQLSPHYIFLNFWYVIEDILNYKYMHRNLLLQLVPISIKNIYFYWPIYKCNWMDDIRWRLSKLWYTCANIGSIQMFNWTPS